MIIDTRGKACPEPLIMTKRAISQAPEGESFEVWSNNATSCGNLMSYLSSLGIAAVRTEGADGITRINFALGEGQAPGIAQAPEPQACPSPATTGYAVVIRSALMGAGDDELGAMLMRSCVNSLGALDTPPALIVLYNGGVKLALQGTDTATSLAGLETAGTRVLVCGTCVDFFGVGEQLGAGTVSNILQINNALAAASHVLYP